MAGEPLKIDGMRARLAMAGRRFNAWWEGYAFDPALEGDDVAERHGVQRAIRNVEAEVAEHIWGAGRREPGDPAWTMRHARTLGLPTKARVFVFGAGGGAPLRDLKTATRWKVTGFCRTPTRAPGLDIRSYDVALTRPGKAPADGAICLFELHRDPDPSSFARLASEMLRAGAPMSIVDFTMARKGARLKTCFPDASPGAPRVAADTIRLLKEAGFSVADSADETRLFAPLIAKGWAHWRRAYESARGAGDARIRADMMRFLGEYAFIWAERLDALKSGHLQVTRFQARKAA
jgi:hypothetical protein